MNKTTYKIFCAITIMIVLMGLFPNGIQPAQAISDDIVISQVYGGGGNTGAQYKNDFIELFNRGSVAVDISSWSVQYASATGSIWSRTDLSGTIQPGKYYLIQEAAGTGTAPLLPTPDAIDNIAMSAASGKVALVTNQTSLTCGTGTNDCFPNAAIRDFAGYGTANNYEGTAVGALANITAALRNVSSCSLTDTDNNNNDFTIGAPTPRNSAAAGPCDSAPSVSTVTPTDGAGGVAVDANITLSFSEDVTVSGSWYDLTCTSTGTKTGTVSGGPLDFTINPDSDFAYGESCTLTVYASLVSDQDLDDPPDTMVTDFASSFSTGSICDQPYTPIYEIQGSGLSAAITGTVTTKGIVIADEEGASPALQGFYIQDMTGDGLTTTSDGIFIANPGADQVSLDDIVVVTGTAGEYEEQTRISSVTNLTVCGSGTLSPVDVSIPFQDPTEPEQWEGMLIRLHQTLVVTDHYYLGRFGQITLSYYRRLYQPTSLVVPALANDVEWANTLNHIIVDDSLNNQNPDPILFARGGLPLSATNTLRGGDTVTGIVGVMTHTWAGNSASGTDYRVRPIHALGGGIPNFTPTNERPSTPTDVGGTVKVAGMNLYNYFNTFSGCTNGVGGAATDCRGANSQVEFDRQYPKIVNAIIGTNADVIGVSEVENDGYGTDSAIQDLVNKLNAASAPGTYAFLNADALTGQVNVLGTDAIKVGLLFKPAHVTPVGTTAVLNSVAFVNGGDSAPRNWPSLVQAFQTSGGAQFIVSVNHLKSKGSPCDADPDPDPPDLYQGNCNIVRTNAVNALLAWLATDPTGTGNTDILIFGDLNSYAKEDPIAALEASGYTNLIEQFNTQWAYSYLYNGWWGYLDHALASPSLLPNVSGVTEWHINADEPVVLDYNTEYKNAGQLVSLYSADQYRASDHDPILIGLNLDSIQTTITSAPPSITTSRTASFAFTSNDPAVTFECSLDGVMFAACTSPRVYSGLTTGVHNFEVRAVDSLGNPDPTPASHPWTINLIPTFRSVAAQDGWILEYTENSNLGGGLNAVATTFTIGDGTADKQYRSILSFNTTNLPDKAVIAKVTLKIRVYGVLVGNNNPFTWGQGLRVDVCKGTFGTSALQLTDFNFNNTTNCRLLGGTFGSTPTSGWYSVNLINAALGKINPLGLTQFRLRFYKDDNDDGAADYWRFFSGNYATANLRPTLLIEYYVP